MRLHFFFLLSCLAAHVSAFALAGGYERMLYWYAYQMDIAINGKATKIAPECTSNPRGCSFNDFLGYIAKKSAPQVSAEQFPDVDRTARSLYDLGLTGEYVAGRIMPGQGLAKDDIPKLLNTLAGWLRYNLDKVSDDRIKNGLIVAAQRGKFFRKHFASTKVVENVTPVDWEYRSESVTYSDGTTESFDFVRVNETGAKRGDKKQLIERVKDVVDAKHGGNIKGFAAVEAAVTGQPEC
ncbi:hypothetical protein BDV11DRAFT_175384 [Aspergillus similis]